MNTLVEAIVVGLASASVTRVSEVLADPSILDVAAIIAPVLMALTHLFAYFDGGEE